jgi:hypothetical protein
LMIVGALRPSGINDPAFSPKDGGINAGVALSPLMRFRWLVTGRQL